MGDTPTNLKYIQIARLKLLYWFYELKTPSEVLNELVKQRRDMALEAFGVQSVLELRAPQQQRLYQEEALLRERLQNGGLEEEYLMQHCKSLPLMRPDDSIILQRVVNVIMEAAIAMKVEDNTVNHAYILSEEVASATENGLEFTTLDLIRGVTRGNITLAWAAKKWRGVAPKEE